MIVCAGLVNVPVTTWCGRTPPVVRLPWSSVIRQVRPASWTVAGTAQPRGMLTVGLTKMKAMMNACSPAAMTLLGWYGGGPPNWIGEVATTSKPT